MFISLNKKILYSIFAFILLLGIIFFSIFINFYTQKLQENRDSVYLRNQYVVGLLMDNIRLQGIVSDIAKTEPELMEREYYDFGGKKMDAAQLELSNEQKLSEELRQNYHNSQEAIKTGFKILLISLLVVLLMVLLLIVLLDYWVIRPINRLINISNDVSAGVFSSRLPITKSQMFKDEFDVLYSTFNNMLDSTEQNIEETKMRETFLQQLIDAIPDGIRVIDNNKNVIMANIAFYNLLKIKTSCIGKKCYLAYGYKNSECPQSHYNCPLRSVINGDEDFHAIHEVDKMPLYVNASKLKFGPHKNDYYVIEAFHDLSKDVHFSHQQKVSSLAFLSTSVAHEMKNNLGAIRLILEGILENDYKDVADDDKQKKYLIMAHKQLVESIQTPERLLKLAQYSETDVNDINIASAIKDIVLMVDYEAKRRGISIGTEVADDVILRANEADFKMIILNLAQNALKAMPNGGELHISGEKKENYAFINIQDTGIGIEPEKIKHIFEPFYSANSMAKSSGLGLAIVSSLVEKFKGRITVKSKVGKGTTFTIKLPLATQENDK